MQRNLLKSVPVSSNFQSDDSTSSADARRRNINYVLIVPRMDIRRSYPQMFVNIINSQSTSLIHSFFVTYCAREVYGKHTFGSLDFNGNHTLPPTGILAQDSNRSIAQTTSFRGALHIVMFFALLLQLVPDQILLLKDGVIRTSSVRTTTEIECNMIFKFSAIYDANPMKVADDIIHHIYESDSIYKHILVTSMPVKTFNPTVLDKGKKSRKKMTKKTMVVNDLDAFQYPDIFDYCKTSMNKTLSAYSTPRSFTVTFKFILLIDSARRIFCVEMVETCLE